MSLKEAQQKMMQIPIMKIKHPNNDNISDKDSASLNNSFRDERDSPYGSKRKMFNNYSD